MTENEKLFSEFPSVSKENFEAQVIKDLKGKNYIDTLFQENYENIEIAPLNVIEDLENLTHLDVAPGKFPYIRGFKNHNDWEIRQDIIVDNTKDANNKGLEALMKGATSLGFDINVGDFHVQELIQDILIENISINFLGGEKSEKIIDELINEVKTRNINKNNIKGSVNFDPIGNLLLKGNWYQEEKADYEIASLLVKHTVNHLPNFKVINVSGKTYHNAGASLTQEIAYTLAHGNEYLAKLSEAGIPIDDLTNKIQFTFSIGSNYLMEIAKLRAFRMLWSTIVNQYQPKNTSATITFIHCETSAWNQTIYDPWVNILRGTTEAMSAVIGGADSLSVLAYDNAFKNSDEFSERIARNTQLILAEESYLNKVVDPAGGSYYLENLTDSLAKAAWELFQNIESKGGIIEALKTNYIQEEIEKIAILKKEAIKTGKEVLLGTNKHPNKSETMANKIEKMPIQEQIDKQIVKPLQFFRASEYLEKIRIIEEKKVSV